MGWICDETAVSTKTKHDTVSRPVLHHTHTLMRETAVLRDTDLVLDHHREREQSIAMERVRRYCEKARERERSPLYLASEEGDLQSVRALCECECTHYDDMCVSEESEDVKRFLKETLEGRISKMEEKRVNVCNMYGRSKKTQLILILTVWIHSNAYRS